MVMHWFKLEVIVKILQLINHLILIKKQRGNCIKNAWMSDANLDVDITLLRRARVQTTMILLALWSYL